MAASSTRRAVILAWLVFWGRWPKSASSRPSCLWLPRPPWEGPPRSVSALIIAATIGGRAGVFLVGPPQRILHPFEEVARPSLP